MKKKILVGATVIALALSTGVVAYATMQSPTNLSEDAQSHDKISTNDQNGISFDGIDKNDLPEGIQYQDEVSINDKNGIPLDGTSKNDLPEGVFFVDEIAD